MFLGCLHKLSKEYHVHHRGRQRQTFTKHILEKCVLQNNTLPNTVGVHVVRGAT